MNKEVESAPLRFLKIQQELKVPKSQENKFGKYKYRSCEDILEAIKKPLLNNQMYIIIEDDVHSLEGRVYIKATVTIHDCLTQWKISSAAFAREAETQKGMSDAQVTGATSSYARKYALNGVACIDDTKDDDATNQHGKGTEDNNPVQKTIKNKLNPEALVLEKIKKTFFSFSEEQQKNLKKVQTKSLADMDLGEREEFLAYIEEIKKEG